MMRSIQLHVPSLAIGVAACALVLVSMSQGAPQISPPRVSYGPNPRDFVQIKEGTPYTVPAGTLFVLTGLGCSDSGVAYLRVNGQNEAWAGYQWFGNAIDRLTVTSMASMPSGFSATAGSVINVDDNVVNTSNGRAWGYLSR